MLRLSKEEIETLLFLGFSLVPLKDMDLQPGDKYIAHRNFQMVILTVKQIDQQGYVIPNEKGGYIFELRQCRKIVKNSTPHYLPGEYEGARDVLESGI